MRRNFSRCRRTSGRTPSTSVTTNCTTQQPALFAARHMCSFTPAKIANPSTLYLPLTPTGAQHPRRHRHHMAQRDPGRAGLGPPGHSSLQQGSRAGGLQGAAGQQGGAAAAGAGSLQAAAGGCAGRGQPAAGQAEQQDQGAGQCQEGGEQKAACWCHSRHSASTYTTIDMQNHRYCTCPH